MKRKAGEESKLSATDKKKLVGITVNQHIINQQREYPQATGEFTQLLSELIVSGKVIRDKIGLAGIAEILGHLDHQNVQGETVAVLDELSNQIMKRRLLQTGQVCLFISEEDEEPTYPKDKYAGGKYVVSMDPCDGSSNINCNVPVGTIFGIWERKSLRTERATQEDALQPGRKMVCAGYILYGPSSMFVYTTGKGVYGFTYDPSIGEFILTHNDVKLPEFSKCYSVNECYAQKWDEGVTGFVNWIKTPNKEDKRPFTARYVGSLVSDFHRNLLYGGIYFYPNEKNSTAGKLRLMYECAPLAFIAEQAGGLASTGHENILDIVPSSIHQRVSIFIGNKKEVLVAEEFVQGKRKQ